MYRPHLHAIVLTPEEEAMAGRLRRDVDMLAGVIGERHWWKYDHLMTAEKYVHDQLAATGLEVTEQVYEVMGRPVRNLVATQPGKTGEVLVLGAHYDSVSPTPGADDNASAVAGMLEAARQLAGRKFRRTIRYVAFVNEEPPFYKTGDMGSWRYAQACHERGDAIRGMINLEMIGYFDDARGSQRYPPLRGLQRVLPQRGNFINICSNFASARFLAEVSWGFWRSVRFPMLPFPSPPGVLGPDMSDHWSFWKFGYPAVMVTDTSFLRNENYHTVRDTPDTLHYPAMTRVVGGVIGALARLAG